MKNTSLYRIICNACLWMLCVLCIASCKQESVVGEGDVTVNIRLKSSGLTLGTRGVADDPKNASDSWSTEELLVDGSRLYRVTLLVVDNENRLVGFQDWNEDIQTTLPTEVSTEIRGLKSNVTYRIIAVANYSAYSFSENHSWAGLSEFPDLAGLTLGEDVSDEITALNSYTLTDANRDRVVAKQPQPLSMVRQFTISSGVSMDIEGELLRTYARIRIEITNRSKDSDLKVNGLRFGSASSGFGQNNESLLPVGDEDILDADGNLLVASGDAIVPFASLSISRLEDGNENSSVVFDGYIYECKNTDELNYSLDLEYPSLGTYSVYEKGSQVNLRDNSFVSGFYMIECGNNYYLSVENHELVATYIDASETTFRSANAIWYVTKERNNNTDYYYFQSEENTSSYIKLSSDEVGLTTEKNQASMLLSDDSKLYYKSDKNSYYLSVSNGTVSVSQDKNVTKLTFYSVDDEEIETISERTVTIPLQTIADGVASSTDIIRRNDFFNVSVSVNYNKTFGQFEYQVQNWTTVGGSIDFN